MATAVGYTADINENQKQVVPVFRTFEDGYIVRGMTQEDAKIVQKWYSGMGIISPYDLDIALSVFPVGPGFYIGEYQGEVVSSVVYLPWGNQAYYGSYYYVEERFRGKGFGTRLKDQVAFEHVGDNRLCVDAVEGSVAKKNVDMFKYSDDGWITRRLQGVAKDNYDVTFKGKIIPAVDVSLDDLIAFDNKNFISKDYPYRRRFLEKLINIPDGASYVAVSDAGAIIGFGDRRAAVPYQPNHHLVGPLYADSPEIAEALLARLCQDVPGDNITINVWTPNEAILKTAEKFDFKKVFDVIRMHANGNPDEFKSTVYCVTSIDTCGF